MLFYPYMNGTQMNGSDQLRLAILKAEKLALKYPNAKITVEYSTWYEGKKRVKGENNYEIININ